MKFQQRLPLPLFFFPFLLSKSPPSKPLLLMLKSYQGLARVKRMSRRVLSPRIRTRTRRSSHWPRPIAPRMISRLGMWSPRPRMLSLSPRPRTPNLKAANPKKDLLASSLCIIFFFFFFFFVWLFTIYYNVPSFGSMKRLHFLLYQPFFFLVTFILLLVLILFCPLMRLGTDKIANNSGLLLLIL